jgi:hypothetical protein
LIVTAGVVPAATFGIEIHGLPDKSFQVLMHGARQACALTPIGVPTTLCVYAWRSEARPDFKALAASVLRYAREVWMAVGPGRQYAHGDELTRPELTTFFARFQATAHTGLDLSGVLGHLQVSLKQLHWQLLSPTTMLTRQDTELDLTVNSPAEIRTCLISAFESQKEPGGAGPSSPSAVQDNSRREGRRHREEELDVVFWLDG